MNLLRLQLAKQMILYTSKGNVNVFCAFSHGMGGTRAGAGATATMAPCAANHTAAENRPEAKHHPPCARVCICVNL